MAGHRARHRRDPEPATPAAMPASRPAGRRRRAAAALTTAGVIVLAAAGGLYLHDANTRRLPTNAGHVPAAFTANPSPRTSASGHARHAGTSHTPATSNGTHPGRPLKLRIAALDVTAAVTAIGTTNGGLTVPDNPQTLGWWKHSAKPGSATGAVILDGHVDSAQLGLGAFFHLDTLALGSHVHITTPHGTITYRVIGRRVYVKAHGLPPSLFNTTGPARLVMITCGGPFDHATLNYLDNVVVYAVPVTRTNT